MFYYGVYFYDFVCGGHLLSGETTRNERAHSYRRSHLLPDQPTDPDLIKQNIPYWPVNLLRVNNGNRPRAINHGFIEIPAAHLTLAEPNEYHAFSYRYFTNKLLNKVRLASLQENQHDYYPSPVYLERGILAGIHEAQHTHFWYLEKTHFNNDLKDIDYANGPLKSYVKKGRAFTGIGLNGHLNYYGGVGSEFAALATTSVYVKRYHPILWELGYRRYYETVRSYRRRLATTKKAIIRPK